MSELHDDEIRADHRALRMRRLRMAFATAVPFRLVSAVVGLLSYSIASRHLIESDLAAWLTVASVASLLSFADLGLGASATSEIASQAPDSPTFASEVQAVASSAMAMLLSLAVVLMAVAAAVVFLSPVGDDFMGGGYESSLLVAALVIALGLPSAVGVRAMNGLQLVGVSNVLVATGTLLAFLMFAGLAWADAGLNWLIAAAMAGVPIGGLLCLVGLRRRGVRPLALGYVRRSRVRELFRRGKFFFLMSIGSALSFGSDTVVLSAVSTPGAVVEYSAVYRMFTFLPMLVWIALAGIWPAVASAISLRDTTWVRHTMRRLLLASVSVNVVFSGVLLVAAPAVLRLWLGDDFAASSGTLIAGAIYAVTNSTYAIAVMYLNGLGEERFQTYLLLALAPLNLVASLLLARSIGAAGPIAASAAATGVGALVMLRRATQRVGYEALLAESASS